MTPQETVDWVGGSIVATAGAVFTAFKTFVTNGRMRSVETKVDGLGTTLGEIKVQLAGYDEVFQYLKEKRAKGEI